MTDEPQDGDVLSLTLTYDIFDEVDGEFREVEYSVEATRQGLVRVLQAMDEANDDG